MTLFATLTIFISENGYIIRKSKDVGPETSFVCPDSDQLYELLAACLHEDEEFPQFEDQMWQDSHNEALEAMDEARALAAILEEKLPAEYEAFREKQKLEESQVKND